MHHHLQGNTHQLHVPQPKLLISIGPALTRPTFLLLLAIKPDAGVRQIESTETNRSANIVALGKREGEVRERKKEGGR